jgi:hypothetical protein
MDTTTSFTVRPKAVRRQRHKSQHTLHLEVMIAGAKRAHFVLLPMTRLERHGGRDGAGHAAVFLDAIEIGLGPVAAFDGPPCAALEHGVELAVVQVNPAAAADACRHTAGQLVREVTLDRLDRVGSQSRAQGADAARDIEPDAARRHDAALLRIERCHAANRKSVPPVRIGHGVRRALNARQHGDVGDLLTDFLVHVTDERLGRVDHAGHAHRPGLRDPPLAVGLAHER